MPGQTASPARATYRKRVRAFKDGIKSSYPGVYILELMQWKRAVANLPHLSSPAGPPRLLFVPCDPYSLDGSRGDQAMISGTLDELRSRIGEVHVGAITASQVAAARAAELGLEALPIWNHPFSYPRALAAIAAFGPAYVAVIGADVIDGYYSAQASARMLLLAEAATRMGAGATVLGFSFNEHPAESLKPVFRSLGSRLVLNARDDLSATRLQAFTGLEPTRTADVAFLMHPDGPNAVTAEAEAWIAGRRASGRTVLACNLHPLLIKNPRPGELQALAGTMAGSIRHAHQREKRSWVLLPHDFRPGVEDSISLDAVHAALGSLGDDVFYARREMSASQLKRLAALTDGVITGRMHLAIAALGSGIPVLALTYQDKFQGLFRHFEMGGDLLMSPQQASNRAVFDERLQAFLTRLPQLREDIGRNWPMVKMLARRNLDALVSPSLEEVAGT